MKQSVKHLPQTKWIQRFIPRAKYSEYISSLKIFSCDGFKEWLQQTHRWKSWKWKFLDENKEGLTGESRKGPSHPLSLETITETYLFLRFTENFKSYCHIF
jgi:hypothetical protein